MVLTIKDFARKDVEGTLGYYFSAQTEKYEVCLESCLDGFDVAVYERRFKEVETVGEAPTKIEIPGDLVGEKTCTNIYACGAGVLPGDDDVWTEALYVAIEIANKKLVELEGQ